MYLMYLRAMLYARIKLDKYTDQDNFVSLG
jgi:hypothetical protein